MITLALVLARAGGGENFGGGGASGGGGGGGGFGVGYLGPGVFVIGAVVVVAAVAIAYPLFLVRRRGEKELLDETAALEIGQPLGRLPAGIPAGADGIQLTRERAEALAAVAAGLPGFDQGVFSTAVERAYFAVHQAMSALAVDRLRHLVAPPLASDLERLAARVSGQLAGKTLPASDLAVGGCILDTAWTGDASSTPRALVGATVKVAITPVGHQPFHALERLVFVYDGDAADASGAPAGEGVHCRACGAPFETDLSGACRHCGANLTALAGWTLVELIPVGHDDRQSFDGWIGDEMDHHGGAVHFMGGLVQVLGAVVDVTTGF